VGFGVSYPDMNIKLGESLSFSSFSHHDVVLVHDRWEQCSQNGIGSENMSSIFSTSDFTLTAITAKHYTPPTCGTFLIACSVGPHCAYGQRFQVKVNNADGSACASPCTKASCITSASKADQVDADKLHDVKPNPNSGYWGQGPYTRLEVDIGDTVLFRTGAGFHDVATVPNSNAFASCDMSSKTVVAEWQAAQATPTTSCTNSNDCCPAQSCGSSGMFVTYRFSAETAGANYFVCSIGHHCKQGQTILVSVKAAMDADAALVSSWSLSVALALAVSVL